MTTRSSRGPTWTSLPPSSVLLKNVMQDHDWLSYRPCTVSDVSSIGSSLSGVWGLFRQAVTYLVIQHRIASWSRGDQRDSIPQRSKPIRDSRQACLAALALISRGAQWSSTAWQWQTLHYEPRLLAAHPGRTANAQAASIRVAEIGQFLKTERSGTTSMASNQTSIDVTSSTDSNDSKWAFNVAHLHPLHLPDGQPRPVIPKRGNSLRRLLSWWLIRIEPERRHE